LAKTPQAWVMWRHIMWQTQWRIISQSGLVQIILLNSGQRSLVELPRECPSETPILVIGTASTNKLHKAACSPKHARSWKEATGETLLDLSRSSVAMRTGQA